MWVLYLLSWVSSLLVAIFALVCISAGLYFLAEAIEEYSVAAGAVLRHALIGCVVCNVLVGLVEPIPLPVTAASLCAHGAYYATLKAFPLLEMGPAFYSSCALLLLHNYLAFSTFAETWFSFDEFLAYFVICVWLVPFGLFISLSVNDNVLPSHGGGNDKTMAGGLGGQSAPKTSRSGVLVALDGIRSMAGDFGNTI
eukprot:m.19944 g.19944  ORF g.19944 m.19944 type:complete len:197 (-) comp5505_c0_seq1:397-987(-)